MKNFLFLYIPLISFFSVTCYAQKSKTASADKKYDNFAYIRAVSTYEKIANKGYKSEDMFQKLGNSYYFNGEFDKAAKWYGELFTMNPNQESEYFFRYAQSLKAIGQAEKANQMLETFNQKEGNDIRGNLFKNNKDYLEKIKANSGRYEIEDSGINSKYSDYGSSFYGKKLVFSSARDTGGLGQRKHTWTNQHFTNLYSSDLDEEMIPGKVNKFSNKINSKFNESTPVFTKDGKTMYFTRNNYLKGKKGKNKKEITLVKIYKASFENGNWDKVSELPFNSDSYSTAHPTLSSDEETMYFVSDMSGTKGQSDIFKVKINAGGGFGKPENLGNEINTEGRETFPHITDENELYFASDGHPGLGGLDVFVAKIESDGSVGEIQNVGDGVNSPKDDFAYLIDMTTGRGFFTSNRDGGKGFDDIYKFTLKRRLICAQELQGNVRDLATSAILADSKISLYDSQYKLIDTTVADAEGNYKFAVECRKKYNVRAEKQDYLTKEQSITIPKEEGLSSLPIGLEKDRIKVTVGDDLSKSFGIDMIYFALGKYDIQEKALLDLEKILDVMTQNPTMKIDVRSHTDCRSTAKYNQTLSENRAKSTMQWLIDNGLKGDRLTAIGYGETKLLNDCGCEGTYKSNCTEEQHQVNRRSEFIITSL